MIVGKQIISSIMAGIFSLYLGKNSFIDPASS